VPGVTTTYFTGTLTSLLVGLVTSARLNVAAVLALVALLAGAVAAGLFVAQAAVTAVPSRSPCWRWSSGSARSVGASCRPTRVVRVGRCPPPRASSP
jgi:hypothetical protein